MGPMETLTNGFISLKQTNSAPINIWTNTAAGTTYWTNATGFSGFVIVGGGTISAISLNGTTLGMTNATVPVSMKGTVGVTYSSAPSMVFIYQ
jgi:hypothetical protein